MVLIEDKDKKKKFLGKGAKELISIYNKFRNNFSKLDQIQEILESLSFIQEVYFNPISKNQTSNLKHFFDLIVEPVNEWILEPFSDKKYDEPLWIFEKVDYNEYQIGQPTELAQVLDSEIREIEDEGDQKIVREIRDHCRSKNNQDLYGKFRRFLIENPIIDKYGKKIRDLMTELHINHNTFYEPISPLRQYNDISFLCPFCNYPMKLNYKAKRWNCLSLWCKDRDAFYYFNKTPLDILPHIKLDAPKQISSEENIQIKRDFYYFTTIPGLLELSLNDWINNKTEMKSKLWPNFDIMDLEISSKDGQVLQVDIKCWTDTTYLLRHLKQIENQIYLNDEVVDPEDINKKIIVIPNIQKGDIPYMNSSLQLFKVITDKHLEKIINKGDISSV